MGPVRFLKTGVVTCNGVRVGTFARPKPSEQWRTQNDRYWLFRADDGKGYGFNQTRDDAAVTRRDLEKPAIHAWNRLRMREREAQVKARQQETAR